MTKTIEFKPLHVHVPKKTWVYVKTVAAKKDTSMAQIVSDCIDLYKKYNGNLLTEETTSI